MAIMAERAVFGTSVRERILKRLLHSYYASDFRRQWVWEEDGEPHFMRHAGGLFGLVTGDSDAGPLQFARAFYALDVIREGDVVLDIGCGDGTFTRRFYAPHAAKVDAVDIEPGAIAYAQRWNGCEKVRYAVLDAVTEPFPSSGYDVIIFDGAIGHFSQEGSEVALRKVANGLKSNGVFCGSESLGREGHDHLQFFSSVEDLRSLLKSSFRHVRLRENRYPIKLGRSGSLVRREAYWRCSNDVSRLDGQDWS